MNQVFTFKNAHRLIFQVFSEIYKSISRNQTGTFLIDSTVGRSAKFQMDFIVSSSSSISTIEITFPNGTVKEYPQTSSSKSPFIAKFDFLEVNKYLVYKYNYSFSMSSSLLLLFMFHYF